MATKIELAADLAGTEPIGVDIRVDRPGAQGAPEGIESILATGETLSGKGENVPADG